MAENSEHDNGESWAFKTVEYDRINGSGVSTSSDAEYICFHYGETSAGTFLLGVFMYLFIFSIKNRKWDNPTKSHITKRVGENVVVLN